MFLQRFTVLNGVTMVAVAAFTGVRKGELRGLLWENLPAKPRLFAGRDRAEVEGAPGTGFPREISSRSLVLTLRSDRCYFLGFLDSSNRTICGKLGVVVSKQPETSLAFAPRSAL